MQVLTNGSPRVWFVAALAALAAAAIVPALVRTGISAPVTPQVPVPWQLDAPSVAPFVPVSAAPLPVTTAAPTIAPAIPPQTLTQPNVRGTTTPASTAPLAPGTMPRPIATSAPRAPPSSQSAGHGPAVVDPANPSNAGDAEISPGAPSEQTTVPGTPIPRG
jgi:hypothetical protein